MKAAQTKTLTSIILKSKLDWFENFSRGQHWRWAIIQTNECKNAFQLDVNQKANLLNAMLALLSGEGSVLIMRKSPVQIGRHQFQLTLIFNPVLHCAHPAATVTQEGKDSLAQF